MYKLLLCWRYLRTRYIALASIISVTLGVATMIVVNSVMAGFSHEMQSRINGVLSDLVLESRGLDGFGNFEGHRRKIMEAAGEDIEAMTPTVAVPAMFTFQAGGQWINRQVMFIGIDAETYGDGSVFDKYLQHPASRAQLSCDLREGGYDTADHTLDAKEAVTRHGMTRAGWVHRRMMAEREAERRSYQQVPAPDYPSERGANANENFDPFELGKPPVNNQQDEKEERAEFPPRMVARELGREEPLHRLAPPDVILVDVEKLIPKGPYPLRLYDIVAVQVGLPDSAINDTYQVMADGTIELNDGLGKISVVGQTVEQAIKRIQQHVAKSHDNPRVTMQLEYASGAQQIAGQHLIAPDGTINLGEFEKVYVSGQTLPEAKVTIQQHLKEHCDDPKVIVDMLAYNNRVYYVIDDEDGNETGPSITSILLQGHETILDAFVKIGNVKGLTNKDVWLARPAENQAEYEKRLPIDITGILNHGETKTNYALQAGDRIYIEDKAASSTAESSVPANSHDPFASIGIPSQAASSDEGVAVDEHGREGTEFDKATEQHPGVVVGMALTSYRTSDGQDHFLA
ncbi:MAG: polysaccharide biosynthesis/export family protein, partial [Pirellulales bacterium]